MNCFYIHLVNRIRSKRKVKRNLETSNRWPHIVPKACFQGRLGDVLRTSWGHPLDFRLGRPQDVISRRSQDFRSGRPRDGQAGSLGDILETLERDVLGTSWVLMFAGWINCIWRSEKIAFRLKTCVLYFHILPKESISKFWIMNFISLKRLFLFTRYSGFCIFYSSIPQFPDSKRQMKLVNWFP